MCNGPHTRNSASNHHANNALALTVQAHAVWWNRGRAAVNEGINYVDELILVDRATTQFEINLHVGRNRSGFLERGDVFGPCVNDRDEFLHITKIPERLDTAGCGTSA